MTSDIPVLLFFLPFVSALLIAGLAPFVPRATRPLALIALLATALLAVRAVPLALAHGSLRTDVGGWAPPIGIELVVDPLSALMAVLVAVTATVVLAGTAAFAREEYGHREPIFLALTLLLVSGLMGIVTTGDLFNLFVHLEVASLSAYALIASGTRGAPRAGLRYLLIGSFGASLYLAGIGFLYGATGTLNMADLASRIGAADPRLVRAGGLLIVTGLAVKMGLYPLHLWMPSAYARGPVASVALMAPLVTKVSAYALLRLLFWTFGVGTAVGDLPLAEVTAWLGAAAVVAGGAMAFVHDDFRRVLAYSSVGQIGIVAMGIGLADVSGLTGAILHLVSDALVKGALFVAAGIAVLRFGVRDVDDLHRLRGRAPWTSAAIAVAGLSLIGVPPLAGFYGKWYVLNGALMEGRWAFVGAIALGSIASIGYVFRIIERLYFVPAPTEADDTREGNTATVATAVLFALGAVVFGLVNAHVVATYVSPALPAAVLP